MGCKDVSKWARRVGTECTVLRSQRRRGAYPAEMSKSVTYKDQNLPQPFTAPERFCNTFVPHPPVIITHHSDSPQVAGQRGTGEKHLVSV